MNLYFYMVVMVSFFGLKFSGINYELFGIIIVVAWSVFYYFYSQRFTTDEFIPLP